MLWAKNKPNLSVVFTEEPADQKLLEAIDKELTANKYQTFSNLCKQAIWQFLYEAPATQPTNTTNINSVSTSGIEKSISELAQKFNLLEQQLAGKESAQLQEMAIQLERLSQQLTKMQANLDMKFVETVETLKSYTPPGIANLSPIPTGQPVVTTPPVSQSIPATPHPSPIKPFEPVAPVTVAQTQVNEPVQEVPENLPIEEEEELDPVIKRLQGMMESF